MGLSYDTAITTNALLFAISGEQELENLVTQSGETDWSDLQAQCVNELIRDLKGLGYDPSQITNERDLRHEVAFRCLQLIWGAEAAAGRIGAADKALYYRDLWQDAVSKRYIEVGSTTVAPKAMPRVGNLDQGHWFKPERNDPSNRTRIGEDRVTSLDDLMIEGPD